MFNRDVEDTVVPTAAELGTGFVPYSPLGRGFLTGAFDSADRLGQGDSRSRFPQYSGENAERNAQLLSPLRRIAERHGATPGQVALAWVHYRRQEHGLAVVPIPGTRRAERVDENLAAVGLHLSTEDLIALDAIAGHVVGTRYPTADMALTSAGREG